MYIPELASGDCSLPQGLVGNRFFILPFLWCQAANSAGKVTERERFCRCTDPSLPFLEGILPHRCICQANKGFPPSEVCREQEFRTDNLPLRLSWTQRPEELRLQSPPVPRDFSIQNFPAPLQLLPKVSLASARSNRTSYLPTVWSDRLQIDSRPASFREETRMD